MKSAALKAIEGTAIPPAIVDKLSALQIPLPAQVRFFESVLGVKAAFRSHLTESIPLKRGGADAPWNMQWQTIAEGKAKDAAE